MDNINSFQNRLALCLKKNAPTLSYFMFHCQNQSNLEIYANQTSEMICEFICNLSNGNRGKQPTILNGIIEMDGVVSDHRNDDQQPNRAQNMIECLEKKADKLLQNTLSVSIKQSLFKTVAKSIIQTVEKVYCQQIKSNSKIMNAWKCSAMVIQKIILGEPIDQCDVSS